MGYLTQYIKERFSKNNSESKDIMSRQRVKNSVVAVCEKYLVNDGDTFVFEALSNELPYVVSVITDNYIKSRYNINQISDTLFTATLQTVDLDM